MAPLAICLAAAVAGLTLAAPAHADPTTPNGTTTPTSTESKPVQQQRQTTPAWKVALKFAMKKRGIPYVWGGTSDSGYDCSGLMLRAYEHAGIELPRTTTEQYSAFSKKISWDHLKPGDLVFFHGLGHVGMISRPGYMVHAPHTGDVVKEEKLSDWRRDSFAGAVRPDPKGVRLSIEQRKTTMLTAGLWPTAGALRIKVR
ncbi:C40 family peptidase [Nonomuraea aurantiaca]|uniref:C40 family peptidase n=1 Tax=Nonomuraea aurantiaca TaxID=2878562 RepID=UPI001CDA4360|nr:C40 family peptidase [Nonomuraea aurantiaca]MCA2219786.1 C40 family peptidase [Nonomuraea aurantiaca]